MIPALNEENYLGATLRHLVEFKTSSTFDVEIVVVDGRSIDNTLEIAEALADVVLVEPEERGTIARARNLGTSASSGRVVFQMDADSRIPFLDELAAKALNEIEAGEWVCAVPALRPYPWEQRWIDVLMHQVLNLCVTICLPLGGLFAKGECQIMARGPFLEVGGYDEEMVVGEDCDLFRRLRNQGSVVFLHTFSVFHSTRRFRRLGYRRVFAIYLREVLWLVLFRRNYLLRWDEVR